MTSKVPLSFINDLSVSPLSLLFFFTCAQLSLLCRYEKDKKVTERIAKQTNFLSPRSPPPLCYDCCDVSDFLQQKTHTEKRGKSLSTCHLLSLLTDPSVRCTFFFIASIGPMKLVAFACLSLSPYVIFVSLLLSFLLLFDPSQ